MNIIFLGDGITDAGRNTSNGSMMSVGQGYVLILAAEMGAAAPQRNHFFNAGAAGSRVVDLYARIQADAWNRSPELISILVGVNDVLQDYRGGQATGVDPERFAAVYQMMLDDSRKRFPGVRFLLMEPFIRPDEAMQEHWAEIRQGVALRADVVRRLAAQTGAAFVPLQRRFDAACERAPQTCWLADGVHPTPAGHRLIADAWTEAYEQMTRDCAAAYAGE